jgi:SHS family lactate transporter-like MFS transporter
LVINLVIIATLEIGVSFVQTFHQFLALRAMFGVAMGGIWGLAAATALENLPVELRGLASGVVQQGYAAGYLIAAVTNLTLALLVPGRISWRAMFWVAACFSSSAACLRALLPESAVFLRAKELQREQGVTTGNKTKVFLKEIRNMLAKHWLLCVYAVVLMTGKFPIICLDYALIQYLRL